MIRAFRETVVPKQVAASFRQGWQEAQAGDTYYAGQEVDRVGWTFLSDRAAKRRARMPILHLALSTYPQENSYLPAHEKITEKFHYQHSETNRARYDALVVSVGAAFSLSPE